MTITKFIQMFSLILVLALMCSFIIAVEAGAAQIPVMVLVVNALEVLLTGLCCSIIVLAAVWFFEWEKKRPSYGALKTRYSLFLNDRYRALAQKNAAQIAPALQYFLYNVLRRCKAVLGIDPGPDCGSLSPNGRVVSYRNNALYYFFELVLSSAPEQDIDTLKKLINQFIFAELLNYGVANLPTFFYSQKGKAYPAIYLDRLSYDEVRHVLVFEVLFIGSEQAAAALERAWERDKSKTEKPEVEVYDDEI